MTSIDIYIDISYYRIPFQVRETFSSIYLCIKVLRYFLFLFYPWDFFHHVVITVKLYLFIILKITYNFSTV